MPRPVWAAIQSFVAILLVVATAVVSVAPARAAAEARTALIVGNSAYGFAPLANPVNDATDMAAALRQSGFDVTLATNADQPALQAAVKRFTDTLKARGGVGLFFFAGHGIQVGGENYIVPVMNKAPTPEELRAASVAASDVVDAMTAAGNALNIVVLDACRDNPLPGTGTKGLSRIDSGARLFVSFSTSPGAVALDGEGRNSPYTKHLARALLTPGLNLEDTFKRTLKGVYQETAGKQTPWLSSSFFGDFVFREAALAPGGGTPPPSPRPTLPPTVGPAPAPPPVASPREPRPTQATIAPQLAGIYRADGRNPDGSRYKGMVALQPTADGMRFTWWIGRQIFRGTGEFAGRMLVVNWGQTHPVVYSFGAGAGAVLDGEWADGTATERLVPFALAAPARATPQEGRYRVAGRNADGSRYSGTLTLRRDGDLYRLNWKVGSSYQGTGRLDGNILTVDWGAATPVVYALGSDGRLTGLWEAGRGEEVLTPE